jgi:hypothetical protein
MLSGRGWRVVHFSEDLLDDVINLPDVPGMGQDELSKRVSAGLCRPGKNMPALFPRELKPGRIKNVLQPDKGLRAANTGAWLHVASTLNLSLGGPVPSAYLANRGWSVRFRTISLLAKDNGQGRSEEIKTLIEIKMFL